jgi:TonB family protein
MRSISYCGLTILIALAACTPPRQQLGTTKPSPIPTSCANLVNADTAVYDSSGVSELPRARIVPPMTYPPDAQRAKIHGRVMVAAIVSATGSIEPASVTIIQALHPLLDQEAVRAVSAATLWPGCRNGQPVRVRVGIPVVFARGGVSGPLAALIVGAAVINVGAMVGAVGN